MLLKIRHALVEVSSYSQPTKVAKQSSIIINNEIIITTGSVLKVHVQPTNDREANICVSTIIINQLQQCKLINVQNNENDEVAKFLNSLTYHITFDGRKLPVTAGTRSSNKMSHILTRRNAKLLYIFNSQEISRYLLKLLNNNSAHNDVLLGSFLILSMHPEKPDTLDRLQRFLTHIIHYLRFIPPIHVLDDVLCMCTPFGMENFYKTVSIGKISNVMGRTSSTFVLSNNLPLGCEGSAVFNSKLHLIGLIVCTSFQYNEENVNLTLASNFPHLLADFLKQMNIKFASITLPKEPAKFTWERNLVVVNAGGNQGSGTLVQVLNKRFLLTCSHVLYSVDSNSKICCRSIDGEFQSDILWRNPQYNAAFDVALLSVPQCIPTRYCVRVSQRKPGLVKRVYNAGFPYYVNFHLKYDFSPSIFQGRIIRCTPAIIMSDGCVQAGQSGGPMFDECGGLIGICVSNFKMDKMVYPNINCAVPLESIRNTLQQYAKSNDVTVLNNLLANSCIQKEWSLATPVILGKL